jgi:RNA polymerase sigma-70 factor, ECF subfamily
VTTLQTDEELALGVQQGSREDFTMIMDRHYSPLLGYLYRMCGGTRTLAEDMVQETFLRLLRGIRLYQPTRPFKPWLYAIATNIARNHYALADTRHTSNLVKEADYFSDDESTEETVISGQAAEAVLGALGQLPPHQREVVVLFYYQELSQKEIADTLHIPVGTVKSRLSLGLRRLRELMEQMGEVS